jgi:hypothetical protein
MDVQLNVLETKQGTYCGSCILLDPPLFQLYSNLQNGTHLVLFVPKSCLEQMKLIPFVDNRYLRFAFGIHKWNKMGKFIPKPFIPVT